MATSQVRVPSRHGTLEYLRLQYDNAIASGVKRPLLFPQMLFSMALLAGFLLIDHRHNPFLYQLRWLVWFAIIAVEASNIRHRISVDPVVSYVSGIASVYVIVWSTMWLIFERPQFTAVHIERRRKAVQNGSRTGSGGTTQERSETIGYKMNGNGYSLKQQMAIMLLFLQPKRVWQKQMARRGSGNTSGNHILMFLENALFGCWI